MSNLTLLMYQSNTLNLVKKQENYYVDNRSMNRKEFIVHKGMDNIVYINITNQDRKKENVYNNEIQADIIKYSTNEKVLTRFAVPGLNKGTAELKLSEEDMNSLVEGQYKVSFKNVADDGTKTPIYSDYNNGILCTLIVKNDANPTPVATQIANVWNQTGNTDNGDVANVFTSGSFEGNQHKNFRDATHTIGIYSTEFTGNVFVEGSLSLQAPSSDDSNWASVPVVNNLERIPMANVSGVTYYSFTGNFNYLRFKDSPGPTNSGSFDKILLRN